MKNYKEFDEFYIGSSYMASLTARSCQDVGCIDFGKKDEYYAHSCHGDVEIPSHCKKVFSGHDWLILYDDQGVSFRETRYGECVDIYRAGEMECIIHWHE